MRKLEITEIKLILIEEPLYEADRKSWARGFISCLRRLDKISTKELAELINFISNEMVN